MTDTDRQTANDHDRDLLVLLDRAFVRFARRAALRRESEPVATELSYAELRLRISARAAALAAHGVGPGARVALLCENRPSWVIAFLGALHAGATVVPLDTKLGNGELAVLLAHARPRLVLTSDAHRERAHEVTARLEGLTVPVISIEADDAAGPTPAGAAPVPARASDEPALIIYTSGTTGQPKGVTISFGNLLHQVHAVGAVIGPQGRERFLSILPLCHLYELICGLLTPLSRGATISYPPGETLLPAELTRIMKRRRVTSLVGVPLLYRALARGIEVELRRASKLARSYVAAAGAVSARLPFALRRLIHRPILARMGGCLHQLYSGGAPLDAGVARTFERMGLPILQGYGLSETSPVIATNAPGAYSLGSVGRPLPGVEVRIAPRGPGDDGGEGEILARGPNVMLGYLDRPDLTAQVIDADGWLHTGDLGRLDRDGFLHVTGRAKDLIVLGGGKKVYPDEVEQVLAASPGFAEVCVLGVAARQGHDEVCAVVVPAGAPGGAASDAALLAEAEAEIARMLADVAAFKRPTRVVVRREPIPRTTTRKAKRAALATWIHALDQRHEAA